MSIETVDFLNALRPTRVRGLSSNQGSGTLRCGIAAHAERIDAPLEIEPLYLVEFQI